MTDWLSDWWIWVALALFLGIVEILLPSFFFLGFSLGALALGVVYGLVPELLAGVSFSAVIALFAVSSLVAWLALRFAFRRQSSGSKIFTKDIND